MKASHWVDPSFMDVPEDGVSLSGKRKASSSSNRGQQRARRRSRPPHIETSLGGQDQPWVDRHAPHSQAELVVHKKKVEEVEKWLRANSLKGGVLLLTGPSGCGKTATVHVLSLEMGLTVQEWSNPSNLEPYSTQHEWRMNGFPSCSQLSQFQEFLFRANRYSCLKMAGDRGAPDRKLILVEDFPNLFYRQPATLHDILRRFVKTSRCPLVFIVSDSLSGDSSSRFLFPKEIQEELNISSISFNPVAPTTMMKVLSSISTLEAGKSGGRMLVPDQAALESLCSGSSGDIRSAINSLQFSSLQDTSLREEQRRMKSKGGTWAMSRTKQRKVKPRQVKEQQEQLAIGGKDASLFLFRALGKILHCKRGNPEGTDGVKEPLGPGLPAHLSCHDRVSLQIDPELVVERSHMSGEFFNLYLHQNYLDFFSQVEDVDRASDYLSDADLLTADWTSRGILGDYGSSLATRGLLHSNSQQVSVGFRPLHKPHWLLVSRKYRENCLAAQSLFRSFCMTPVSLQTDLLPYLAKLTNPMRNQAQITFIQDVGQMSLRRFPPRLTLETLTDKEPSNLEEEQEEEEDEQEEEGQDGAEESLPASQPQPTTAQVLCEEVLIEEYSSD